MGYRSDSIAVSRDMGPLSALAGSALELSTDLVRANVALDLLEDHSVQLCMEVIPIMALVGDRERGGQISEN